MMGKSHMIIGTGVTLSALALTHQHITLPVIAVTAISSILPDADEPNSLIWTRTLPTSLLRLIQFLMLVLAFVVYRFGAAYVPWNIILAVLIAAVSFLPNRTLRTLLILLLGVGLNLAGLLNHMGTPWTYFVGCTFIVCAVVPHRGITHTLYGVLGWSLLLFATTYKYDHSYFIAGGIAYLLHLLCDAVTDHGIRPLPPFKFRFRLRLMSTGGTSGFFVESGFIALTAALVWFVFFRNGFDIKQFIM